MTRTELARRMGVSPPVITRLLNGAKNTTVRTLLRIAFALDTVLELRLGRPEATAGRRQTELGGAQRHGRKRFTIRQHVRDSASVRPSGPPPIINLRVVAR